MHSACCSLSNFRWAKRLMRRLSWHLRTLDDVEFGQRVDRWFGAGAAIGLLTIARKPVGFGALPGDLTIE